MATERNIFQLRPPSTAQLWPGKCKQSWRLERVLGVGGSATVFLATHRNGSRVAIEILDPALAVVPQARARFLREGYFANAVEHPGVVRVLDDDVTDDGTVFLVMDFLDGTSLEQICPVRASVAEAAWVANQVLSVLEAAHAQGIVHRDLKPENIFITRDGQLRVLDFGIAARQAAVRATLNGLVLGTPAFMAPEQARGDWDAIDARTDLWAVAAIVFLMLTGRLVHEATSVDAELVLAATEPSPPVRQYRAGHRGTDRGLDRPWTVLQPRGPLRLRRGNARRFRSGDHGDEPRACSGHRAVTSRKRRTSHTAYRSGAAATRT